MDDHTPTKVSAMPSDSAGVPGIWVSDGDPIDKALTDNAVVMVRMARDLLNGPGPMGTGELRYLAVSLVRSLGDVLDVMGVDHD